MRTTACMQAAIQVSTPSMHACMFTTAHNDLQPCGDAYTCRSIAQHVTAQPSPAQQLCPCIRTCHRQLPRRIVPCSACSAMVTAAGQVRRRSGEHTYTSNTLAWCIHPYWHGVCIQHLGMVTRRRSDRRHAVQSHPDTLPAWWCRALALSPAPAAARRGRGPPGQARAARLRVHAVGVECTALLGALDAGGMHAVRIYEQRKSGHCGQHY